MPEISVIITSFNRKSFIEETLKSVLNQTYSDYEIILVDDGSTDNTKDLLAPYLSKINYIYQKNQGTSKAKNRGIKESSGEYIAFLDSDDLWERNKLEKQIHYMKNNPERKISYTEESWIRKGKRVNPGQNHRKYSGWILNETLLNCFIGLSTVMIKKELFNQIGLFNESLVVCEDYDLWLRIATHHPIYLITEKLTIKKADTKINYPQCIGEWIDTE